MQKKISLKTKQLHIEKVARAISLAFFQVYQKFEGYQISVFLAVSFDVLKAISPYIYFLGI